MAARRPSLIALCLSRSTLIASLHRQYLVPSPINTLRLHHLPAVHEPPCADELHKPDLSNSLDHTGLAYREVLAVRVAYTMKGAMDQMSESPRPAQRSQIESSCASDTLGARNAATTRAGRHSWQVDNPRAEEEGSDLAGEEENVKEGGQAQTSRWGVHKVHLVEVGGALGLKERGGMLGRASVPGYSKVVGLAHGWDGRDGYRRRVGMVAEPRHAHRQHAQAAHKAPLEVRGSWEAV